MGKNIITVKGIIKYTKSLITPNMDTGKAKYSCQAILDTENASRLMQKMSMEYEAEFDKPYHTNINSDTKFVEVDEGEYRINFTKYNTPPKLLVKIGDKKPVGCNYEELTDGDICEFAVSPYTYNYRGVKGVSVSVIAICRTGDIDERFTYKPFDYESLF